MRYAKMLRTAVAAIFSLGLVTGTAMASEGYYATGKQGDRANGERIFKNGKDGVPACVICHGADGSGNDDMGAPMLAGQFFTFLWKQLEDFANQRRTNPTGAPMFAVAASLTPQERIDVAAYLSNIPPPPTVGSDLQTLQAQGLTVGEPHLGRAIVEYGSPVRTDGYPADLGSQGKGIPACKSCHGFAGDGAPPLFPKIGQQRYTYLVNQLKAWRDGSRDNDLMGQMQAVARMMSDEDIYNAAAYLTNASPYTLGNFRTPYDHRFNH